MSQTAVANAMGTSQSHIARIEAGEENLTLNTLERLIVTLNGRLSVSIQPAELMAQRMSRWWDVQQPIRSATTDWSMVFAVVHRDGERAIVGLMRGSLLGDGNAS